MPDAINAAAIPGANLRPDMVEIAAGEMSKIGDQVGTQAATVVTTWQRLSASYDAPEDTTLFGVMDPVKTNGETFDANMGKVSSALKVYAAEVEPIKAELAKIKLEAYMFLNDIAGGVEKTSYNRTGGTTRTVEWHEDQDSVDANNALIGRVNDQMELLWAAERKCANAIYDIIGFPHISAASESNPNGYGVEDIPEGAETPWGTQVERTESCGERVVKGVVVDGLWGTVVGLGTLTLGYNPQTGDWFSGDAYAAGWSNLGMLAVGLLTAGPLTTPLIAHLPGPAGDFLRRGQETLLAAGKGLIAYDTWKEDPARAAGATVFNLGTLIIPVGAATAPVRASASTAAAAIRATAKVVNLLDPVTLVGRAGGAAIRFTMPAVSDALRALDFGGMGTRIDIPDLPTRNLDIPTVSRPDMTVDTPRMDGDVDVPIRTPEDAVSVPPVRERELVGAGSRGGGGDVTVGSGGGGGGGTAATIGTGPGSAVPAGAGAGVPGGTGPVPGGGAFDGPNGGSGGAANDGPNGGSGGAANDGSTGGGSGNGGGPTGGAGTPGGGGTPWDPEMGDPTLSPAEHGPDFVRDQTNRGYDVDPEYGQPRADHGTLDPKYGPPPVDELRPEIRDLVTDRGAPYGRGPDGQPYSKAEWEERYVGPDGYPIYPGNDGAVAGRRIDFSSVDEFQAHYGDVLDRMGGDTGKFMSFPGTPFEHRALPGSNLSDPYLTIRLTGQDLPSNMRIEVSEVAPAFGRDGGGLQVRIIKVGDDGQFLEAMRVNDLRDMKLLEIDGDTSKVPEGYPLRDDTGVHHSDRWGTESASGDGTTDPPPVADDAGPAPDPDPTPASGSADDGPSGPDGPSDPTDPDGPMSEQGARRRPRDLFDMPAQQAWAREVYDEIVADPGVADTIAEQVAEVPRASGAVGFSPEEIAQIRDHLMVENHPIHNHDTGAIDLRRFDADEDIASAWLRLRDGSFRDSDIVLLEHELVEAQYLREHPGASYRDAHVEANQAFNWEDLPKGR